MEVGGRLHAMAVFTLGKSRWYPLYRGLGGGLTVGLNILSERKSLTPTGNRIPDRPSRCLVTVRHCVMYVCVCVCMPVPVAARSKAWVCGRSPAEIVGSNPTGGMDVCLL